jgi:hypothetical protein
VDLAKNRKALAIGVAAAGIMTAAVAMVVWPALMRADPPLEKAGDDGLSIRVVEPPKAAIGASTPLDVGLSEAAQAMAKGGQTLFVRTPPAPPRPIAPRPRAAPVQIVHVDDAEDTSPPLELADDRWEREARRPSRFEQAQRRRLEDEALARETRYERAAWEQEARDRRRWEDARERDRHEDSYPPPPEEDPEPPPGRW